MLKIYLLLLSLFPALGLAYSCADIPLSHYAMLENQAIVAIKVTNVHEPADLLNGYIEASVIQELTANAMTNTVIAIKPNGTDNDILKLAKNSEWVIALLKSNDRYVMAPCAPALAVENGIVIGKTGIAVLDNSNSKLTIEILKLALNAYQQGLASADAVCQSDS